QHAVFALAAAGSEQNDWDRGCVHHAIFQRGKRAAQTTERCHLHVALLEPGLLHHQHSHHLAERFRVADAELLALKVGGGLDRGIGHDDQHQVGERARREADDLDVLPLFGGGDDRGRGDVAVAEIAGHGVAHRAAAARAGDDAGDVEPGIFEKTLLERDAVGRAGRVVLVLGHEEIRRVHRRSRCKSERRDDDAVNTHTVLRQITSAVSPCRDRIQRNPRNRRRVTELLPQERGKFSSAELFYTSWIRLPVTSRDHDGRVAHSPLLDQGEQRGGIRRMQSDTAVGSGAAEAMDLVTAMDRVTAVEEDRIWHGRVVVQFREPHPFHSLRPIRAAGRAIAGAARRNNPAVAWHAVHRNRHLLRALVDGDEDIRAGSSCAQTQDRRGKGGAQKRSGPRRRTCAKPPRAPQHCCGGGIAVHAQFPGSAILTQPQGPHSAWTAGFRYSRWTGKRVQDLIGARTMKAAFIERYGGPAELRYGDVPDPVAGPGEVVIDVQAASINAADWKVRAGQYQQAKFPLILGRDFSGVISAAGDGVTDLKVGDAVFGVCEAGQEGAYAGKIAGKGASVAGKPDTVSHVNAAALALTGLTALSALEDTLKLKPGETILIQGGAGGVAGFAIQLAKHIGARVITTASAANHDYVRG